MSSPTRSPLRATVDAMAIALPLSLGLAGEGHTAEPTPDELVDALNGVFGRHPGLRGSHARGLCARGRFEPASDVDRLTRSKLFRQGTLPAEIRLSIGGGNPKLSDKSRSVRGLALRLQAGGESYDLVMISEPVFFASTPAGFVSFLKARTPDPATGKPDPERLRAHDAQYPSSRNQPALLASHAAPASYATTAYHANHAFRFVPARGAALWARVEAQPLGGVAYLSPEAEATLPDRFLEDELRERLARGPVQFALRLQPAGPGDALDDPSLPWRTDGPPKRELGRLSIDALTDATTCDGTMFVPTVLPDGIEPSDDPILQARGPAYGVSLGRRLQSAGAAR